MLKRDLFSICTFYAISPVHAGAGASLAAVDLPIQRSGIPAGPMSGIGRKGNNAGSLS